VKSSTASAFANGGVPTFEEYHLSERRSQRVVDSAFMHHRWVRDCTATWVKQTPFSTCCTALLHACGIW
jgi:hypothetical protein